MIAAIIYIVYANPAAADVVYGVTGAGGTDSSLYSINPTSGAGTLINPISLNSSGVSLTGITYDPQNGALYGLATVSSSSTLININTATGVATSVGALGGTGTGISAQSIAYDSYNGNLYCYVKGTGGATEGSYVLNTSTGAAALVGSGSLLSGTSGNGLGINSSGTIYLAPFGADGQTNAELYTINPATGVASPGPAFTGFPTNISASQMKAMAFDSSGNMVGLDFQPGNPYMTDLVSINPTTAVITEIGSTQNGLNGLAFEATSVPEPSSIILAGFTALGFFLLTRQGGAWRESGRRPLLLG